MITTIPRAESVDRSAHPLFQGEGGGSTPTSALYFSRCPRELAVRLTKAWHSRLPNTQNGPWMYAFCGTIGDKVVAVALWNNPSARCLPQSWMELRRMAVGPDAPPHTASKFLAWMAKQIFKMETACPKLISYQDTAVHKGTIYKACGWIPAHISKPRVRDRSKPRIGTVRMYRSNANGIAADASSKVRWEKNRGEK